MLVDGKRELAYTAKITKVAPIEGADNIELVTINDGWKCIAKKTEFNEGDTCVYFEIDSKLPEKEWSEFLRSKKFKVKTMKLGKFGVASQGLALPINAFTDDVIPTDIGIPLTTKLGVTYGVEEDNDRKASSSDLKYKSMASRHPNLAKTWWWRKIWKMPHGKQILFLLFGKKKDKPLAFPAFVKKTDEERIENEPWRIGDKKIYLATEKLDGTSTTFALKKIKRNKYEFFVCSRNVRQMTPEQNCAHDHNIYWDMAIKYDIENVLRTLLINYNLDWICLQGESVGSVQGNPLKLDHDDFYGFNLIFSDRGRLPSDISADYMKDYGIKWVPILGEMTIPNTMEEAKKQAYGKSIVNPAVLREGIVYRSLDGQDSFKNVSVEYLLKHNG